MTETSPVVLVEDHRLLAQAVTVSLQTRGVRCVELDLSGVPSRDGLMDAVLATRPSVVWLDLDLGHLGEGDDLVRPLISAGCRVLVVTGDLDQARWGRLLRDGAAGVLPKSTPLAGMVAALHGLLVGEPVTAPGERDRLVRLAYRREAETDAALAPLRALTPREAQVLQELAEGRQAAEIAHRAFVSETTVRAQIRAVLRKLDVSSQLQAVAVARRVGWDGRR